MDSTAERNPSVAGRPLEGRTVIVTRARAQAAEFASILEGYGARVILCPMIETTDPESYSRLDEALEDLYGYDWLIFTSVNGVEFFLKRLTARGHDVSELDELRVCAIGDATALKLREGSVHVDVVPTQFKAEGVYTALEDYLGGREGLKGLNFLVPRAAAARDFLPQALEAAGARVDVVPAYRTVSPDSMDRRKIEALLAGGGVDCVTFSSSSTVTNFAKLFDTPDLSPSLDGVAVACIGDITSNTAAEFGLECDIMPTEFTIPALARAIASYFSKPRNEAK